MASTTNYSWSTPDDTALVKDGASAIRTLGSSVDTTVKNLNPSTTLGDIEYRSSTANTNTRLGIGTSGQYLTVSGGVPAWGDVSAGGMTLISTTTLSGASVTLSSIPQTYNDLIIIIKNPITGDDNEALSMRVNADSTASRHRTVDYAVVPSSNAFNLNRWTICPTNDNAVGQGLITFKIPNYTNATTWKTAQSFGVANQGATPTDANVFGYIHAYNQTGAITSFSIFPNGGTLTSGTVLLYGVK